MFKGHEAISWVSSVNFICVPIGCVVSGAITQAFGRKRTMQITNIPFLVAWLLFSFSTSVWQVFLALIITGLNGGLMEAPVSNNSNVTRKRLNTEQIFLFRCVMTIDAAIVRLYEEL